uniref:Uncharacterized protein n=1 Tax=Populus trichocarpa TaxID=3694 RepID=U7DVN0_POPTR
MEDMREDLKLRLYDKHTFEIKVDQSAATRELKAVVLPILGYACPFKSYWFSDNTSRLFHNAIHCDDGFGIYPIAGPRFKSKA